VKSANGDGVGLAGCRGQDKSVELSIVHLTLSSAKGLAHGRVG